MKNADYSLLRSHCFPVVPIEGQGLVIFPLSVLACQLLLSLDRFCLTNHIFKISFVQLPYHIQIFFFYI